MFYTGPFTQSPSPAISLDANHHLIQGLIGCWFYNKNKSAIVELSGQDKLATVVGGNQTSTLSDKSPAVTFTNGDYYSAGSTGPLNNIGTSAWTLESYVRPTSNSDSGKRAIFNTLYSGSPFTGLIFAYRLNAGGHFMYVETYAGGAPNPFGFSTEPLLQTRWNHVVLVRDRVGGVYRFYLNGLPTGTVSDTITAGITGNILSLGGNGQGSTANNFPGHIAWWRAWRRALSPSEILRLYINPFGMFLPQRAYTLQDTGGALTVKPSQMMMMGMGG